MTTRTRFVTLRSAGFALLFVVFAASFVAVLCGCVSSSSNPQLDLSHLPGRRESSTSQPASQPADPAIDVQQLAGQVVAGVKAEVTSAVTAAVNAQVRLDAKATGIAGNATGYQSEFGVGAVVAVSGAMLVAVIVAVYSLRRMFQLAERTFQQSTDRELARIQRAGK